MTDHVKTPVMPVFQDRRPVVLEHRTGRFAGLRQIMGNVSEFEGGLPEITPPTREWPRKDAIQASLVASKARYVLYREIVTPADTRGFDRRQR